MPFSVEHQTVTMLARSLSKVPDELRKELRPQLRAAAGVIVRDMKSRASYSTRIPGAIRLVVSFSGRGKGGGVRLRVDSRRAPHARVLERGNDGSRSNTFRHPVFGDRDVWASQPTQPFFLPALEANRDQVRKNISAAVKAALRKAHG